MLNPGAPDKGNFKECLGAPKFIGKVRIHVGGGGQDDSG